MKTLFNRIKKHANFSPVLTNLLSSDDYENSFVLPADMRTKDLGIMSVKNGLVAPDWFKKVVNNKIDTIIIKNIDSIAKEDQNKFHELLKYQTIAGIKFPQKLKIIISYSEIKNVSNDILSLCQVVR